MVWFVDFVFGFTLMVGFSAVGTGVIIASMYVGDWLGWKFRQGSLAREAQRELAKARVRAQRAEYEALC